MFNRVDVGSVEFGWLSDEQAQIAMKGDKRSRTLRKSILADDDDDGV